MVNFSHAKQIKNNQNLFIELFNWMKLILQKKPSQLAITCSKLTIETLKQDVEYVQS